MLPSLVETGKTIGLTSFRDKGRCDSKPVGSFDVMEGICYQLSSVMETTQNTDQRIICYPNGDAIVIKYKSTDGSCTGSNQPLSHFLAKKDECFKGDIVTVDGLRTNLKVKCPTASSLVV